MSALTLIPSLSLQTLFDGLALGSAYALIALGFAVVYRATDRFNFAQGALVAVGAYLVIAATAAFHLAFPYAAVLAIVASAVIGVAIPALMDRPLSARSQQAATLGLVALSVVIGAGLELVFGSGAYKFATPFASAMLEWRGVTIPEPLLWEAGASWIGIAMVALLLRLTPLGLLIRSGSEGQAAASHAGVNVVAMQRLAFGIGGFCAGVGGLVLGQREGVSTDLANHALLAIPAAAIGGLGSLRGAIIGGLLVGLIQPFAAALGMANAGEFIIYLALMALLILRPRGLFAGREWSRV